MYFLKAENNTWIVPTLLLFHEAWLFPWLFGPGASVSSIVSMFYYYFSNWSDLVLWPPGMWWFFLKKMILWFKLWFGGSGGSIFIHHLGSHQWKNICVNENIGRSNINYFLRGKTNRYRDCFSPVPSICRIPNFDSTVYVHLPM